MANHTMIKELCDLWNKADRNSCAVLLKLDMFYFYTSYVISAVIYSPKKMKSYVENVPGVCEPQT